MLVETENTTSLPSGSNEPLDNNNVRVESFDAAVSEAKKNLENETKTQLKRSRGRPKKIDSLNSNSSANETPVTAQPQIDPVIPAQVMPEMDYKPILKQGLQTPFRIWAKKAKNPALEVTDSELEAPCEYANQMLNYYAPRLESLDPGKAALVMFCLSMFMLVSEKAALVEAAQEVPTPQAELPQQNTQNLESSFGAKPEHGRIFQATRG